MKKHFLFLGFAMLLSVAGAFAQDCDYSGTTGTLEWCLKDGTLTISGDGEMPDYDVWETPWNGYTITSVVIGNGVTTIGDNAFFACTALASVTIGNSVTSIGTAAFNNCDVLPSITIPNSVITVGAEAFLNCFALTSVTMGNSVTSIGQDAFFQCSNLTSINIPNSVTSIGERAFFSCRSLTSINIPSGVTTIEDGVFAFCEKLVSITIPNSVTSIGDGAFSNCNNLPSITIPNSVTSIGDYAFNNCNNLPSITIPNSVINIGNIAFSNCTALTSIEVEDANPNYSSDNGVLFNKDKTTLICCPGGKTGNYVISSRVTSIGINAFDYCTAITSITIPSSIMNIGGGAFNYCTALISITNLNPVPVDIHFYVFNAVNKTNCTLTVPTSAVSAYKNAEVWKDFNIVAGGILVYPKADNPEHGYVTGNDLYEGRATATVTATAYDGYKFVNWTKDGAVISTDNPYSFTVTEDVELVANFEEGVGIDDVETWHAASIQVYPNPTSGELWVDCRDAINRASTMTPITDIAIFDVMGRMVMTVAVETRHATSLQPQIGQSDIGQSEIGINISHLPADVYFIRITTDDGVVTRKVVKE